MKILKGWGKLVASDYNLDLIYCVLVKHYLQGRVSLIFNYNHRLTGHKGNLMMLYNQILNLWLNSVVVN